MTMLRNDVGIIQDICARRNETVIMLLTDVTFSLVKNYYS